MSSIQHDFIEFLLANQALKFGKFTLKSGRISPYFFNLGMFKTGANLAKLGEFYAKSLLEYYDLDNTVLFGPAYKGIPLVSTTSIALYHHHQKDLPFCFNRKEAKDHGADTGCLVGSELTGNVIMLDDVITAGTTVRQTVTLIKQYKNAKFSGILIALDRQERGAGELSAIEETRQQYGIPIKSIICLDDIKQYLQTQANLHKHLDEIECYQQQYGVKI